MGFADKAVVGIFAAIHCAHAIELAHEDGGEQMIQGGRIVGVALLKALELLDGAVVVQIVEMIEGGGEERIVLGGIVLGDRTDGSRLGCRGYWQQQAQKHESTNGQPASPKEPSHWMPSHKCAAGARERPSGAKARVVIWALAARLKAVPFPKPFMDSV